LSGVLRVGLTGGIGSGKSTVGTLLAEHGALVIDSDALAREVVAARSAGLHAVVDAFGPEVLTAAGELDRAAMGRRVFTDPAARARLEAVIHPLVRRRAAEIEATAPSDAVVVHDIPLLVETGRAGSFDVVVVVDAPVEVQVDRLTRERGMTAEEARSRIEAQASRDDRLAVADHVVVNDSTPAQLSQAVDRLWTQLSRHREGGG
jgi:dephospho-CoA kinase